MIPSFPIQRVFCLDGNLRMINDVEVFCERKFLRDGRSGATCGVEKSI